MGAKEKYYAFQIKISEPKISSANISSVDPYESPMLVAELSPKTKNSVVSAIQKMVSDPHKSNTHHAFIIRDIISVDFETKTTLVIASLNNIDITLELSVGTIQLMLAMSKNDAIFPLLVNKFSPNPQTPTTPTKPHPLFVIVAPTTSNQPEERYQLEDALLNFTSYTHVGEIINEEDWLEDRLALIRATQKTMFSLIYEIIKGDLINGWDKVESIAHTLTHDPLPEPLVPTTITQPLQDILEPHNPDQSQDIITQFLENIYTITFNTYINSIRKIPRRDQHQTPTQPITKYHYLEKNFDFTNSPIEKQLIFPFAHTNSEFNQMIENIKQSNPKLENTLTLDLAKTLTPPKHFDPQQNSIVDYHTEILKNTELNIGDIFKILILTIGARFTNSIDYRISKGIPPKSVDALVIQDIMKFLTIDQEDLYPWEIGALKDSLVKYNTSMFEKMLTLPTTEIATDEGTIKINTYVILTIKETLDYLITLGVTPQTLEKLLTQNHVPSHLSAQRVKNTLTTLLKTYYDDLRETQSVEELLNIEYIDTIAVEDIVDYVIQNGESEHFLQDVALMLPIISEALSILNKDNVLVDHMIDLDTLSQNLASFENEEDSYLAPTPDTNSDEQFRSAIISDILSGMSQEFRRKI